MSEEELLYTKKVLSDIENVGASDIFNGIEVKTEEMNLILLNMEIIVNETKNRDLEKETDIPDLKSVKSTKPHLKRYFSFKSPKFTFAFKMAVILTLWEVLSLIFNLPYTKWLYFASIPLMLPYVDDVAHTAKSRFGGTIN